MIRMFESLIRFKLYLDLGLHACCSLRGIHGASLQLVQLELAGTLRSPLPVNSFLLGLLICNRIAVVRVSGTIFIGADLATFELD